MFKLIIIFKAIVEVALFALVGQGILYFFAGKNRDNNFFYGLLKILTSPATRLTRFITPRLIADKYIGVLTFFLVFILRMVLTVAKMRYSQ